MRKKIIILINYDSQVNFRKPTFIEDYIIKFNERETHIVGIFKDYCMGCVKILLYHKEFEQTPENMEYQVYRLDEAMIKFPYLFKKTNPILYRKFKIKGINYEQNHKN